MSLSFCPHSLPLYRLFSADEQPYDDGQFLEQIPSSEIHRFGNPKRLLVWTHSKKCFGITRCEIEANKMPMHSAYHVHLGPALRILQKLGNMGNGHYAKATHSVKAEQIQHFLRHKYPASTS